MNERTMDPNEQVGWSLAACCRIYRVTIREVASHMGITLKRVREVRDSKTVRAIVAWDFVMAIKAIAAGRGKV